MKTDESIMKEDESIMKEFAESHPEYFFANREFYALRLDSCVCRGYYTNTYEVEDLYIASSAHLEKIRCSVLDWAETVRDQLKETGFSSANLLAVKIVLPCLVRDTVVDPEKITDLYVDYQPVIADDGKTYIVPCDTYIITSIKAPAVTRLLFALNEDVSEIEEELDRIHELLEQFPEHNICIDATREID